MAWRASLAHAQAMSTTYTTAPAPCTACDHATEHAPVRRGSGLHTCSSCRADGGPCREPWSLGPRISRAQQNRWLEQLRGTTAA